MKQISLHVAEDDYRTFKLWRRFGGVLVLGLGLTSAKTLIAACLRRLREASDGRDAALRDGLGVVEETLWRRPEKAVGVIADLRSSFVVSVPGIVAERLTLRW